MSDKVNIDNKVDWLLECILLTIHNNIKIYIYVVFFISGFGAGNISILCVLTLIRFLFVLYI